MQNVCIKTTNTFVIPIRSPKIPCLIGKLKSNLQLFSLVCLNNLIQKHASKL